MRNSINIQMKIQQKHTRKRTNSSLAYENDVRVCGCMNTSKKQASEYWHVRAVPDTPNEARTGDTNDTLELKRDRKEKKERNEKEVGAWEM